MKKRKKPREGPLPGSDLEAGRFGVTVLNRQRKVAVDVDRLRRVAIFVVSELGLSGKELNVVLLSDRAIRRLNAYYLGRRRPTDVLAFSQREGILPSPENQVLGDIAVGIETAARQARQLGVPLHAELDLLVIHGILHLLGFDHVGSPKERLRMRRAEARLLRRLYRSLPS